MTRSRLLFRVAVGAIAIAAGVLAYRGWLARPDPEVSAHSGAVVPAAPALDASAPASAPAASASGPSAAEPRSPTASVVPHSDPLRSPEALAAAVRDWLGQKAVQSMLQTDDLARRIVVTVDNLGRDHAPSWRWPVLPTPGRLVVEQRGGATWISADNDLRYTPFVLMCETVDLAAAVELYRRMYPMLQQTYEEIGFPGRSFHARLLTVIDTLLAAPEPSQALEVTLVEVKGSVPSTRPWERYEFAQPELESLTAGQKILLRVGPVSHRRLKARLRELRNLLVTDGQRR